LPSREGVKFGGTGISNANSLGGKGLKEFGGTKTSSLSEEPELAELEPSKFPRKQMVCEFCRERVNFRARFLLGIDILCQADYK